MAMVGVPFGEIARLMGNSPAIVERHYAGVSAARLVHAVEFRKPPANGRAEAVASISA
jgi:hypothetical protein